MILNYSEPTYYHFIFQKEFHNDFFFSTTRGIRHIKGQQKFKTVEKHELQLWEKMQLRNEKKEKNAYNTLHDK